jgi:alpha-ribazole phosphatase
VRLLLARHGATANNAQQRYTGQTDLPMSALGERQAAALAARLVSQYLDSVVSSDLQRASVMAQTIADQHGVALRLDPDLREISMGGWEGATFEEIRERAAEQLRCWQDDPFTYAPPGGETILQVRDRLVRALSRWYAAYPDGTILWVTHGGCLGILLCHLLGMDLHRRWQLRRDNAALSELEIGRLPTSLDGEDASSLSIVVTRLNDTSHLDSFMDAELAERFQVL